MNKQLRQARTSLHLTQEFVAKQVNMPLDMLIAIEEGKQKMTTKELTMLLTFYGLDTVEPIELFDGCSSLSVKDKTEIKNLLHFKEQFKKQRKHS